MEITTTLDQLREDHPFFAATNPNFLRPMTASDETAFERWIGIKQKQFSQELLQAADTEDDKRYVLNLFVAHWAELVWLPRAGFLPKRVQGDQPSASISEGGVSVSWTRQNYQQFLEEPTLAYTTAGMELAEWLRTNEPVKSFVI